MWRFKKWESGQGGYWQIQKPFWYRKNKRNILQQKYLSVHLFSLDTTFQEIESLDSNKAADSNDAPTKIIKANANLFAVYLSNIINPFWN